MEIRSTYRVVVNDTYGNGMVHHKKNECQALLSQSTHQRVRNNIWKTKVVVQAVMPNDHSKQDQRNQKKELYLYSNKQWNEPNPHDYLKQDLYGPLKHFYNRKTYYGEQCLTLCIINYCSDNINSQSCDNPRVCTYCYGEHHILFDTDHLKEDLESNQCDSWE